MTTAPTSTFEVWTTNYLIDRLKYHLSNVSDKPRVDDSRNFGDRKYYNQAFDLLGIGVYKPTPFFIINLSDLTLELREVLSDLDIQCRQFVMKQAVGRIFEDINSELFHKSISRVLQVKFETMTIEEDDDKLLNDIDDHKVDEAARWTEKLLDRYENLQKVVSNNLPNLWPALEFALSVKSILNIRHCTLPFAGILLGPPSSLKTVVIELFKGCENTFHTHDFSPRSWVSHNSAIKKDKLRDVDMLPKTKNKLFLTPELAPTFSARDEDLLQTLGILTSVLDGHGYTSDTGAQGHRGYDEDIMFTWLGAAVDIPYKVHKHLSLLGPKLYFFRLPRITQTEDSYFDQVNEDFGDKVVTIRTALLEYLEYFDSNPRIAFEDDNDLPKIPLDHTKDEEFAHRYIIKLGKLLAPLRAVVPTWETRDSQGSEYNFDIAIVEDPSRAITQLRNLG